ncbi:MAG: CRISPR-associated helicase Cas3' [Nitrospirae bacterium]|nr:CRISPR-associated helicase Cas3' [Nitrospirota bacterium]
MIYFAHSVEGQPQEQWHTLDKHLLDTAELASGFADEFGCAGWGYISGLWHDLGKYSLDFQNKLLASSDAHIETNKGRVDHSTSGAIYAVEKFNKMGRLLAYLIAGHHAGLPDWQTATAGGKSLAHRLENKELLKKVFDCDNPNGSVIPKYIIGHPFPDVRFRTRNGHALWIRMLYSCLVDADFLDTETFYEPEKTRSRKGYPVLRELLPLFETYIADKLENADDTPVNRKRAEILRQCIEMSAHKPAIFTLTVPTGGGKTLSSMAFALNHADKPDYKKKRIIYVIPYTSIIEQTADEFRKIFGDAVLEHHSNVDVSNEDTETTKARLACENWDAPIIVTTSVQFFDSLFSNRSSRCRKLHNIVNSVVILDEVQLLPPQYLNPILRSIKELEQNYNVTFVLCTATQPAFTPQKSIDFKFEGLSDTIEIMNNPQSLHESFRRVDVHVPEDLIKPRSWEDLYSELALHPSVLCIVNRRDDCRILYELVRKENEAAFHLSGCMCGQHRSEVINKIKERLKAKIPTCVISTQLVEAGVDFDFPVVYRALAGLDSIAQAAGRCNREGLIEKGRVVVFIPPSKNPAGYLRQAGEIGRRLLAEKTEDPLSPDRFERFFKELFWIQGSNLDKHDILKDLDVDADLRFSFFTAAQKFKIIDDKQYSSVIVRYGKGADLIELLKTKGPERWLMRRLQRYVVNLPKYIHARIYDDGGISEVHPGIFVQAHGAMYNDNLGFCPDKSMLYEPDEIMI